MLFWTFFAPLALLLDALEEETGTRPERTPAQRIRDPHTHVLLPGSRIFHGTSEDVRGELRGGGYDGVLWTAETPAVAQAYIPISGLEMFVLPDGLTRPTKDPHVQALQRAIGIFYDMDEVEWDPHGRLVSWPRPRGGGRTPSADEVMDRMERIGFERPDSKYQPYRVRVDGDRILKPGEKITGTLYVGTVLEPLEIFDATLGGEIEHDLMNPQYNDLGTMRKVRDLGYDGIRIQDFLQSKTWGNVGHQSIGLFPSGIRKVRWTPVPATNYDPPDEPDAERGWGNTPEYQAWHRQLPFDLTTTQAFRRWFGDSKAVDADGKPMVFYRGVRRRPAEDGELRTQRGRATLAFTSDPKVAGVYAYQIPSSGPFGESPPPEAYVYEKGSSVVPVYLSIRKPLDLRWHGEKIRLADLVDEIGWDFTKEYGEGKTLGRHDLVQMLEDLDSQAYRSQAEFEIDVTAADGISAVSDFEELAETLAEMEPEEIHDALYGVEMDTFLVADAESVVLALQALGYDGVVHVDAFDVGAKLYEGDDEDLEVETWRPFDQTQVKSIFNRGTFDPDERRIDYGREG
jgi:hypothetical protein